MKYLLYMSFCIIMFFGSGGGGDDGVIGGGSVRPRAEVERDWHTKSSVRIHTEAEIQHGIIGSGKDKISIL